MKQAVVGLLAHVDAGKTTLAEAMLYAAGAIRAEGRVDKGSAHMDTDAMERQRGITIFAQQASLDYAGTHFMLLDAPGHVDFSAEAERTLQALDYAVLVVGANDGVQGHTETLWELLERYEVPTFVFVNKMDLENEGAPALLAQLRDRLDEVPRDRPVYVQCMIGQTSYNAVMALQGAGYTDVCNVSGGYLGICGYEYFEDKAGGREPIVTAYNFN